ncbi:MAG: hypothetical protein Q7T20_09325 [Saprospiraceae bacterium]|nr:hypothetical protein [Saprospiraceae bacterium]
MTTAQIKPGTKAEIEGMLVGVSSLETHELELFLQQVAQVLAARKAPSLSQRESELYLKINAGYPTDLRKEYERLSAKKENNSITNKELQELVLLTEQFELLDSERLQHLLELAQLRHIPLEKLLENLGQPAHG